MERIKLWICRNIYDTGYKTLTVVLLTVQMCNALVYITLQCHVWIQYVSRSRGGKLPLLAVELIGKCESKNNY